MKNAARYYRAARSMIGGLIDELCAEGQPSIEVIMPKNGFFSNSN
jgi:hypothetical protein